MSCPVCFNAYTDPMVLPCGHCYCNVCLQEHLRSHQECPICRSAVNPSTDIRKCFFGDRGDTVNLKDEIKRRDQVIANKNEVIATKNGVIANKNEAIANLNNAIREKDRIIGTLQIHLRMVKDRLNYRDEEISMLEKEIKKLIKEVYED